MKIASPVSTPESSDFELDNEGSIFLLRSLTSASSRLGRCESCPGISELRRRRGCGASLIIDIVRGILTDDLRFH